MTMGATEDTMLWLPGDDTPLLDAACAYASHGFRVLPVWNVRFVDGVAVCTCGRPECRAGGELEGTVGKHPVLAAWQKKASTDPDAVRDARRSRPNANIGLAMGGPARLVALDIDGEQGRRSWDELQSNVRPIPTTLSSSSGRADGGEHRIFTVPAHLDIKRLGNRASRVKMGIDTRTDNGQIVVAPSIHRSGARYRWSVRAPVAELPEWLFEALAVPIELGRSRPYSAPAPAALPPAAPTGQVVDFVRPYIRKVIENAAREIASMKEGGRNSLLFAKACTVFEYHVGENLDHTEAWAALSDGGRSAGLSDVEVTATLGKAWRKASESPGRRVPPPQPRAAAAVSAPAAFVPPPPSSATVPTEPAPPSGGGGDDGGNRTWLSTLSQNAEGYPKPTLANVMTILACDESWKDVIAFDSFGEAVVTTKPPPVRPQDMPLNHKAGEWTDEDSIRTAAWLASEYGLDVRPSVVDQAALTTAMKRVVHPVRDYFDSLTWDGKPRLDTMLAVHFGAANNEYTRGVSARWMISAVARIFLPGCQADCTLVLESRQHGTGKSTGLEILAGKDWFASTGLNIGDKDSYQCLRRKMIYELGELTGLRGRELHRTKNFLSERVSNFRASYGKRNRDYPRQNVFAGTTNESQYLEDKTGNRRFWPVKITEVDREALERDRDQLWAEAVARFRAKEAWHVNTPEFRRLCEAEQADRVQDDAWDDIIARWLDAPWVTHYDATDGRVKAERVNVADGILTSEVLTGALKMKPSDITRNDEMRAAEALRSLGWERGPQRREHGRIVRRYLRGGGDVVVTEVVTGQAPELSGDSSLSLPSPPQNTSQLGETKKGEGSSPELSPIAIQRGDGGDGDRPAGEYFRFDDL